MTNCAVIARIDGNCRCRRRSSSRAIGAEQLEWAMRVVPARSTIGVRHAKQHDHAPADPLSSHVRTPSAIAQPQR